MDDQTYTWDANGNLLNDGTRTFTYDAANRLVKVVSGTSTITFTYNGDGHRMSKVTDGVTTTYVVALLGLPQVLVETTDGSSTAYLYGHDLLAEEGTAWAWHLNDGLGSVRQLTDGSGDACPERSRRIMLAQGYTPFGVLLWREGSGASGFGYTGEREDASAGLVFLRARYYDPYLGRFISPDTIIPDFTHPPSLNRYVYVYNNAVNLVDPSGHQGWDCEGGPCFTAGAGSQRWWETPPPPFPYDITAFELGWLWLTEQSPKRIVFDENYKLTQSLMHDEGVNDARDQFYQNLREGTLENCTDDFLRYQYLVIPYIREAVQYMVGYDRVGFFLGSYTVRTHLNDDGTVTFTISDPKNFASGTRNPLYWFPDWVTEVGQHFDPSFDFPKSEHSLEGLIMGDEQFFPSDIFLESVLKKRSRSDPGHFGIIRLGGEIRLVFTWTEPLQTDLLRR